MALRRVAYIESDGVFVWERDVFASTDKGVQKKKEVEAGVRETVGLLDLPLEAVQDVMTEKNQVGSKWVLSFKEPWQTELASRTVTGVE
jgi:hypothetical protein